LKREGGGGGSGRFGKTINGIRKGGVPLEGKTILKKDHLSEKKRGIKIYR